MKFQLSIVLLINLFSVGCSTEYFSTQTLDTQLDSATSPLIQYQWVGTYQTAPICSGCNNNIIQLTLNNDMSYYLSQKNQLNTAAIQPLDSIGLYAVDENSEQTLLLDAAADYRKIILKGDSILLYPDATHSSLQYIQLNKTS